MAVAEIVSVPLGYVSTARAWRLIFDEMFPDEMQGAWEDRDAASREQFKKQTAECSALVLKALTGGDLVALIDQSAERKIVPGPRWALQGASASLITGLLLTEDAQLTPCFIDGRAFETWRAFVSLEISEARSKQTALDEDRCRKFLVEIMKKQARPHENRNWYMKACQGTYAVSEKGFLRAWALAIKETEAVGWSKAGRKSKRRIDTAV